MVGRVFARSQDYRSRQRALMRRLTARTRTNTVVPERVRGRQRLWERPSPGELRVIDRLGAPPVDRFEYRSRPIPYGSKPLTADDASARTINPPDTVRRANGTRSVSLDGPPGDRAQLLEWYRHARPGTSAINPTTIRDETDRSIVLSGRDRTELSIGSSPDGWHWNKYGV